MNNQMINVKERIDAMETMINGGQKEPSAVDKLKVAEYGSAFWNHMHTSEIVNELKAGSDGSGRYLIPHTC